MSEKAEHRSGRGRKSSHPWAIPRTGWRDILLRTKESVSRDNVGLVAAGMAFYGLLAIFPGLAALVSIYGLIANPEDVQAQLGMLAGVIPDNVYRIIENQLAQVAQGSPGTLSATAAGSILLSLWGATRSIKAFMAAMNIAYGETEKRGIIKQNLVSFGLTLAVVVIGVLLVVAVVLIPPIVGLFWSGSGVDFLVIILRWPLIAVIFMLTLSLLYRYTPSRENAKWRWITLGSVAAFVLWLLASLAFSAYVQNFGNYNKTYGSLGAVVATMMWLWISAFVTILGAELNAAIEHQTRRDSTTGRPEPLGERGAHVADTVGETP